MIRRTYQCADCDFIFEVECESGDGDPDCPNCSKVLEWLPTRVNIGGSAMAKAVDYTQKIIEEDYGLTDLRDNNREGDVAYKPPPEPQTNERENIEQSVREFVRETTKNIPIPAANVPPQAQAGSVDMNFWGGGATPSSVAAQPIPTQLALAGAKQGPEAGVNPMALLHEGIKSGALATKARIIARWRP